MVLQGLYMKTTIEKGQMVFYSRSSLSQVGQLSRAGRNTTRIKRPPAKMDQLNLVLGGLYETG